MADSSNKYRCRYCDETDAEKFYPYKQTECKSCYCAVKNKRNLELDKNKTRLCRGCGETRENEFYARDFTRCRKCRAIHNKLNKNREIICTVCGETNPENFYKRAISKCKRCSLRSYPYYGQLVSTQGGDFCYLCKRTPEQLGKLHLCVDHDHATGFVRGLLCFQCNIALEQFKRYVGSELRLLQYLTNPPAQHLRIVFEYKAGWKQHKNPIL